MPCGGTGREQRRSYRSKGPLLSKFGFPGSRTRSRVFGMAVPNLTLVICVLFHACGERKKTASHRWLNVHARGRLDKRLGTDPRCAHFVPFTFSVRGHSRFVRPLAQGKRHKARASFYPLGIGIAVYIVAKHPLFNGNATLHGAGQ